MVEVIAVLLLFAMLLILLRAAFAAQIFDLVLAINTFGTVTILLIIVIGVLSGRDYFIDIALLYALVNFVGIVVLLRLFNRKRRGWLSFFKSAGRQPTDD